MNRKNYSNLLLFSLFGSCLWFFGNLYEGIVITPNLLTDSVKKMYYWQQFFTITNPAFFYIPLVPMAIVTTFFIYFKTTKEKSVLKRNLAYAVIFLALALGSGIFIITQINLKLFFGNIEKFSPDIHQLSVLWNVFNIIRVILLAFTIYYVFNAYIFIQKERD
jgi:hypothetical protein